MPPKTISSRALLFIGIGFAFSGVFLSYFITRSSVLDGSALVIENAVAPEQERPSSGSPVRLVIPKLNVDSAIEYVGLTPDGAMDTPKSPNDAAWFELGQRPGEFGSAVIAGHYGRRNGRASLFDDLHTLRKGDKVYVEDDKGAVITFVVRESRRYDADADAAEVFGSSDGGAHLNLITCEGEWDNASGGYPTRLVVFADRE